MDNMLRETGIRQKMMAILANTTSTTISRYVNSNDFSPMNLPNQRRMRYSIEDTRSVIKDILTKNYHVLKKVMAFYNFKGGTGKTSVCYQISTHLALMGFKVLVIDADPQAHLSTSLGIDSEDNFPTLFDVIRNTVDVEDAIINIYPGLDCIPSNLSLTRLETFLNEMPKREERIQISLSKCEMKYDFVIFDTNPTISHLNRNIITYTDLLNIVCETQPYSLNGLKILLEDNANFYSKMQMDPPQYIIIPNKYEDRVSSSAEAMTALRHYYSEFTKPDFAIRKSEDINTSAKTNKPLAFFAKSNSNALEDIRELIHYILLNSSSTVDKK